MTEPDITAGEFSHGWPCFLPDGRHFLYIARTPDPQKTRIYVSSIRPKFSALSSLFDYLCDRNAVAGNPVDGVKPGGPNRAESADNDDS